VFVRPGELRTAEWTEIDLKAAIWRIPAAKMKGRLEHLVPLSTQAVAILKDAKKLTGSGRYVFPAVRTDKRPMSDGTLGAALKRLGYTSDEMTPHGFRAMARTVLAEVLHADPHVIEAQLAHTAPGPLGRAYDRTAYLPQRIKLMQAWADLLDTLRRAERA
jgi:integrase